VPESIRPKEIEGEIGSSVDDRKRVAGQRFRGEDVDEMERERAAEGHLRSG
jgi:hypothetical protein